MSKHTAGPWRLSTRKPDLDGVNVCFEIDADNRINIASSQSQEHIGPDSICEDECLANARMIAAAPELLEALQAVREGAWPHLYVEQQKQIDVAIAKATGEA